MSTREKQPELMPLSDTGSFPHPHTPPPIWQVYWLLTGTSVAWWAWDHVQVLVTLTPSIMANIEKLWRTDMRKGRENVLFSLIRSCHLEHLFEWIWLGRVWASQGSWALCLESSILSPWFGVLWVLEPSPFTQPPLPPKKQQKVRFQVQHWDS